MEEEKIVNLVIVLFIYLFFGKLYYLRDFGVIFKIYYYNFRKQKELVRKTLNPNQSLDKTNTGWKSEIDP